MKVVLVKYYNAPIIHRCDCRHLKGKATGTINLPLIDLTDEIRTHVGWGYLKACKTCDPTGAGR
jgi:hypothetical protein